MLSELRVRHLGVIDDQTLVLGPGLTALTGETGAGKTLIVEAIELLLGGRSDPVLVRPGAPEALVEGRFLTAAPPSPGDDDGPGAVPPDVPAAGTVEVILARAVPAEGRSRSYLDGRMVRSGVLADIGGGLVDLHGQHAHQSLLSPAVQRACLDRAGGVDHTRTLAARAEVRRIRAAQAELGGDGRARAREVELARFQLGELDAAGLDDPDEDTALRAEEERLADAGAHRAAALAVHDAIGGEDGVLDRLGAAAAAAGGRAPLAAVHDRLRAALADLADLAGDARDLAEELEDDPERLVAVGARRQLLGDLRRKYGETLAEVIDYRERTGRRLAELESFAERSTALEEAGRAAEAELAAAEAELGAARRRAAPVLAAAVEARLHDLALPRARFEVAVGGGPAGDEVTWLLAANPGSPPLPLAKIASGGELARTMLAARLVLGDASAGGADGPSGAGGPSGADGPAGAGRPPDAGVARGGDPAGRTLVFDEVDAGIGGEAAVAVGRALAALGRDHQVIVVTHLPQVAAFADRHVVVTKEIHLGDDGHERTTAAVATVSGEDRVTELSRMLSGRPDSATAHEHAAELLGLAADPPRRAGPARPAKRRSAARAGVAAEGRPSS